MWSASRIGQGGGERYDPAGAGIADPTVGCSAIEGNIGTNLISARGIEKAEVKIRLLGILCVGSEPCAESVLARPASMSAPLGPLVRFTLCLKE